MTMTMSMSTACDCWAPAALSQSGGAGCGLLFAACCAYDRLGQVLLSLVGFFCAAALAKTLSRGSYNFISCQLAAVSRRLLPLFRTSVGRCVCVHIYMFVYIYVHWLVLMRGVGLCLLGFCYSADSVFSLRRCVWKCLFTCLFRLTH